MHIAILSAGAGWHVRDLRRAAAELGHSTDIIDFRRLAARTDGCDSHKHHDAVIVRTMPPGSLEQVIFRMDLLHRLRAAGTPVLNPPRALETCIDKYLGTACMEAAGLPVPDTMVCQDAETAISAFHDLGGDVVVKPLFGSEGRGIVRVSDADLAWRTFHTLERTQAVLYLQRYIRHPGWDLRVFVLGGRVLAAMRRYGNGGWRTNIAQGGEAEHVRISDNEGNLAIRAAKTLGAHVAGVDLMTGPKGEWYILEVNAVPGWRSLAPVTGTDVAKEIVHYLADDKRTNW